MQRADRLARPASRHPLPRELRRLRRCEAELGPAKEFEMRMDAVTGEGGWRVAPADEDEPPALRDLSDGLGHHVVEVGVGRHVLIIVEHDGEGWLEPAKELAEEAPREQNDPLAV